MLLWDRNIAITTWLVGTVTTPMLLKTVQSHRINPKQLITHSLKLDKILEAYETFGAAAKTNALKCLSKLRGEERNTPMKRAIKTARLLCTQR